LVNQDEFRRFGKALLEYKNGSDESFQALMSILLEILSAPKMRYMLVGMRKYLKNEHKNEFDQRLAKL